MLVFKLSQKTGGDSWLASQSSVACLLHTVVSGLKISQSACPSLSYPLCPLWKPVPADSLPGAPIPRRHARCHWARRPHVGRGERQDASSACRITLAGGTQKIPVAGMCDISWLPSLSSLGRARGPGSAFPRWLGMWPGVQLTYSLAGSQNMKWSYYSRPTFDIVC